MSPEVGGACPPPCVDFSFDNVEDGRRAILFGGYRPESGASSGAFVLDMETWVRTIANMETWVRTIANMKTWVRTIANMKTWVRTIANMETWVRTIAT